MIRNMYLEELSNDIEFLEKVKDLGITFRLFFPFLKDGRQEIYAFTFFDLDEDKLESGIDNKDVNLICRKVKLPPPVLVEHMVMCSLGDLTFQRGRMGKITLELKDRLQYNFESASPYKRYCIGIGKYETRDEGTLHMCVLIDLYDNTIGGVSFSAQRDSELIEEVIKHVVEFAPCRDILVHSSQNAIYQKEDYRKICLKHGIIASMPEKGSRGGVAPVSTFFSNVKRKMNDYEFTDLQDGIDWLSVYILKYNLKILLKNYEQEEES